MIQIDEPMPINCSSCPCSSYNEITDTVDCNIIHAWIDYDEANIGRYKDCPLQEAPDTNVGKWISMETPPKEDGKYITKTNAYGKSKGVISQDYVTRTVRGKQIRRWEWNNRVSPWITTHWMPLPEPPKED